MAWHPDPMGNACKRLFGSLQAGVKPEGLGADVTCTSDRRLNISSFLMRPLCAVMHVSGG